MNLSIGQLNVIIYALQVQLCDLVRELCNETYTVSTEEMRRQIIDLCDLVIQFTNLRKEKEARES